MKKFRKIIKSLFATLLAVIMVCGVACGDTGAKGPDYDIQPKPEEQTQFLSLTETNLDMTVGAFAQLSAAYSIVEGQTLSWESDNTAVATILSDGTVEAINQGQAKITAYYGDLTATCSVNVSFDPEEQPSIVASVEDASTFSITVGDRYEFSPQVSYCGRLFADGEFAYEISNTDVIEQENGVLVAKANGQTTIDITGSWRGLTANSMRMSVTVKVIDDVVVKLDGITKDAIDVYTTDSFEGQSFANVVDINPVVIVNGQQLTNPTVEVNVANADYATYASNKITGKAFGQTTLNVKYNSNGDEIIKQYVVNVLRPKAEFAKKVNYFSSQTGVLKDELNNYANTTLAQYIYGVDTDKVIIDATIDGQQLTVTENKLFDITGRTDGTYEVVVEVGTATEVYEVEMTVYGQYITEAEDLNVFNVTERKLSSSFYAELGKDIYAKDFALRVHFVDNPSSLYLPKIGRGAAQAKGFGGVLDGKGYSIYDLTTEKYGLFCATEYATIRNIGFMNPVINQGGLLADNLDATNLENVYIKLGLIKSVSGGANVLAKNVVRGCYFKNVYVNAPEFSIDNLMVGALATVDVNQATDGKVDTTVPSTFENCVVVSSLPLGICANTTTWGSLAIAENTSNADKVIIGDKLFASAVFSSIATSWKNTYDQKNPDNTATGGQIINANNRIMMLTGVKQYASQDEMIADKGFDTLFGSFSSTYWSMVDGYLVWGALELGANDGEIYLDMGDASGKFITGFDGNPIKANKGDTIELPTISCFGFRFVGWKNYVTGEILEIDEATGKYLIKDYDGKALDIVALWELDNNIATGPEIEL